LKVIFFATDKIQSGEFYRSIIVYFYVVNYLACRLFRQPLWEGVCLYTSKRRMEVWQRVFFLKTKAGLSTGNRLYYKGGVRGGFKVIRTHV